MLGLLVALHFTHTTLAARTATLRMGVAKPFSASVCSCSTLAIAADQAARSGLVSAITTDLVLITERQALQ
jgi:hypothetical protein